MGRERSGKRGRGRVRRSQGTGLWDAQTGHQVGCEATARLQ